MKRNYKIGLLILIPGLFIIFTQYLWKMGFLLGKIPGLYWLFIALDQWYINSIIVAFVSSGIFLVLLLFRGKNNKRKKIFASLFLTFFVVGVSIICTFPITFAQHSTHLESIKINGRKYNLTAYPMFDLNFGVSECDSIGIFCRVIFRSGDVLLSDIPWKNARFEYNFEKKQLELNVQGEGVIFEYSVP